MIIDNLLNELYKKLYFLPGHPKLTPETSIVYTLDQKSNFFPLDSSPQISFKFQALAFIMYVGIWTTIMIYGDPTNISSYLVGFSIGLIIIILESIFYSSLTIPILFKKRAYNQPYPFIVNTPYVDSIVKGTPINDENKYVHFNKDASEDGQSNYKVLFDDVNNNLRNKTKVGYLYTANEFLHKSSLGDFSSMNLNDYISGKKYTGPKKPKDFNSYDPGNQTTSSTTSETIEEMSRISYYICIIMITWAVYITTSNWGSIHQLYWNILTFIIAIISGVIIVDTYTIIDNDTVIYIKKRLLILAISFGITSVYII